MPQLIIHLLPLSVVFLCCHHRSSTVAKPLACEAHFGKQALFKNELARLGREFYVKCRIKNWDPILCGGKKHVSWYFNGTQLKRRGYYQGLVVRRFRLTIAVLRPRNVGIYECVLPNGKRRTFNVTAREAFDQRLLKDIVPEDPADELPNRVYWLPGIVNIRENYVAAPGGDDKRNNMFECLYYVSTNISTPSAPRIRWTFKHLVWKKLITLGVKVDESDTFKLPHVRVLTKQVSCSSRLVAKNWRPTVPRSSRCFTSSIHFRHLHDEEVGDYSCHVGGGPLSAHQLSKNFSVLLFVRPEELIPPEEQPPIKPKMAPGRYPPYLTFTQDRTECLGANITLKCTSRPSHHGLVLYKRVPNISEPLNYTLKLLTSTKTDSFYLLDPDAGAGGTKTVALFQEYGNLNYTLYNIDFDDAAIYQCSTRNPQSPSLFVQREMELIVSDCYKARSRDGDGPSFIWNNPIVLTALIISMVLLAVVLMICVCYRYYFARRMLKNRDYRCVVVVQPSANAAYPSFLRRHNHSSSGGENNNIDSLRRNSSNTTDSCGSSCLTPSSTLESTTVSPCSTPLVTPLRPPEVRIRPMRRSRRFTRATSLSSGSTRWVRSRSNHLTYMLPDQCQWELPRRSLTIGIEIGEGAFGVVKRGQLLNADGKTQTRVAVKMLKEDFTEEELVDLVKEIEVMKILDPHPNIVRLLGVCSRDGPLCLVNEYAPHGNLRDFLRERRPKTNETMQERLARANLPRGLLTYQHLIDFGLQASSGLEYLSARGVVHRDIAARNVLVGEKFEAKIADFGMSRHVVDYYRKTTEGRLPVKWLPPESLFEYVFTREGDVWSFGILLWEIFSLGGTPYPSIPVERLFVLLQQGYRNDPPFYAFPKVYELMRRCWSEDPSARPRFPEICQQLELLCGVEEYTQILRESPYDDLAVNRAYISMEA